MKEIRVGQVGAGFISEVHNKSLKTLPDVKVVALHDVDEERGKSFCRKFGVPDFIKSFDELSARKDVDVITLGVPNYLHAELCIKAAQAGKHVICEKPLALTNEDAARMIEICRNQGVVLGYAEELCYAPKFVKAKEIVDLGGIGNVFFVKQAEKHGGPYSPWFFQADSAGGGILMDMGCHSLEFCRWMLGKPAVKSVYCQADIFAYKDIIELDDHVILIVEFEGGKLALAESSWTLKGGMISIAEVHGTKGVIHANLLQDGYGLKVFSEEGYGEEDFDKAGSMGWHHPDWEWLWQNGYPQEMADFVNCIRNGGSPIESGVDGKVILEIMTAGYLSAATGKKIEFPFNDPGGYKTPVEIWMKARRNK